MTEYIKLFFDGPHQVMTLFGSFAALFILSMVGGALAGRDRPIEVDSVFGWGVLTGTFTLATVFLTAPLGIAAWGIAGSAIIGAGVLYRRDGRIIAPGILRVLLLVAPLFLVASAMLPSQWDEFSHWLPAPKYLLAFDGFPNANEPFNGAPMLAAYPYGWPILSYLSAQIAGKFISNIGGVLNLLLLITLTTLTLRTALRLTNYKVKPVISWGFASSVILCATIFNPTFIQKIVLTAYSDISTAVTTGAALLAGYYYLDELAERKKTSPWSGAWQLSLLLVLLINLRQSNLVLFILYSLAVGFLAWRDPDIRFKQFLIHLPIIVLPDSVSKFPPAL